MSDGQKWAIYMLMAQHGGGVDDKSSLRTQVENLGPQNNDYRQPLLTAIKQQIDPNVQMGDFAGALPDLSGFSLRHTLGLDQDYPGGGPCPANGDQGTIYQVLATHI
jgi:hypothetical protein